MVNQTVKRSGPPPCKVSGCTHVATKLGCRVVLVHEGDESDVGEVDLCDDHYETWVPQKL